MNINTLLDEIVSFEVSVEQNENLSILCIETNDGIKFLEYFSTLGPNFLANK